jgi:hypothetical protein
MPRKVRPIPKEYHTVTPNLTQQDAGQTIEFCNQAFGAKERMRIAGPNGKIACRDQTWRFDRHVDGRRASPPQPAGLFLSCSTSTRRSPRR